MRASVFTGLDGPDDVAVETLDDPSPGPTEAVVDVEACSINHHDLWILNGDFWVGEDDLPFVAGMDVAGTVGDVGEAVRGVEPGDRVLLCPNQTCGTCRFCREGPETHCEQFGLYHGGLAERALVDASRLVPLADGVEAVDAATLPVAYTTAFRMLTEANVEAGDLVFVPGATGGVGAAAVQLLDVMGVRSVGTTSSEAKLDRLESLDVDHAILASDPEEMAGAVRSIGRVDATLNHLGGPYTDVGLDVLRRGGTMVVCGQTAGPTSEVTLGDLFLNQKTVVGSTMGTQHDLERLVQLLTDGDLDPVVHDTYSLDDAGAAFADMDDRSVFGKLVVTP